MANVLEAVRSGDRYATLVAMRDKIAETIDGTESGRDIAALTKRLAEVMAEIDAIPKDEQLSPLQRARGK